MKILKLTFLLFISIYCNAQSGEIIFERQEAERSNTEVQGNMPEEMKKQFAGLMASMSKSTQKLMFTDKSSNYIDITGEQLKEVNETSADGGDLQIKIKRDPNLEEYYVDLERAKYIHKRNIFGKYFIVNEKLDHPNWKLVAEQKEILDQICMKATAEDEENNTITAWYTMSIPHSIGPDTWGGLPGVILELEEGTGGNTYTATSINLDVDPKIKVPSDGKKISLKKFLKLEIRKTKERNDLYGEDGPTIMIRTEAD